LTDTQTNTKMNIGDKVIYDFYGRDIISRVKDVLDDDVLVVGLSSYYPKEMFRLYDERSDKGEIEGGDIETKISDIYGPDTGEYKETID
jgi:hypothetical protein